MITLYQRSDCPFCWKVRLALAELDLPYQHVDLQLGEKPEALLLQSPTGTVPLLIDDGLAIWESAVILEYLDARYGPGTLVPQDPVQATRVRLLHAYSDKQVGAALRDLVFEKRAKPESEWDWLLLDQALSRWTECQAYLERHLTESCRDQEAPLTAAECALGARIGVAVAYGAPVSSEFPKLSAWYRRLGHRPSWQQAYPTHFIRPQYQARSSNLMDPAQNAKIAAYGDELYHALRTNTTVPPLTERDASLSIEDAYHISLHIVNKRVSQDGERVIGKKIGITSKPVQEMLKVDQPDFGFLTDAMVYQDGADIPLAGQLIQPKAEGEIAFRLKKDLQGPGVTEQDVLDATESIIPCFEIVDSRVHNWQIKIQDTVADNASCGVYVLGKNEVDPRDFDLPSLQMKIYKNDAFLSEGKGAAVQGNPLTAVAWLANTLGEYGIPFKAGEVILSGSLAPLESVQAGDTMRLELEGVGGVSCRFV